MTIAAPPAAGCPKPHRAVLLRKLPVSGWKDIVARQLRALHVDTIRGKILVFGLLATLVPTLATTLVSYTELKQSLSQQVARASEHFEEVGEAGDAVLRFTQDQQRPLVAHDVQGAGNGAVAGVVPNALVHELRITGRHLFAQLNCHSGESFSSAVFTFEYSTVSVWMPTHADDVSRQHDERRNYGERAVGPIFRVERS